MEPGSSAAQHLNEGSPVARALPGFRPRPQQLEMASAVEEALAEGRHLVVEAGTGVGKSFGYLVPLLLNLAEGGGPAVVATRTIALQEQLVDRDIPFLLDALGLGQLRVALAKGRGNYVCLRRLEMARSEGRSLFGAQEERDELERIREWAAHSEDGSLSDLPFKPRPEVWESVRAEQGNCLHKRCRFYEPCGYQRSRRELRAAQLIVANHALVFTDLALREQGASFLPDYEKLIVDEAHEMEEGAAENFGRACSALSVTRQLARLTGGKKRGGLFERIEAPLALYDAVEEVRKANKLLYEGVSRLRGKAPERRLAKPGEFDDTLSAPLSKLVVLLREQHGGISDPEAALEWKSRTDRLADALDTVGVIHGLLDPELVYWAEGGGRRDLPVLRAAPVEVAAILRRALFKPIRSVVMTSATLRVAGSFEHFRRRVGLEEPLGDPMERALGSPFDFQSNCRLILYPGMPDPRESGYDAAVNERIRELVLESGGGAFVLFTSYRALESCHVALHDEFEAAGLHVMRQGEGARTREILAAFHRRRDCVLFATETFWQGIDVKGENLRLVVLTRLPFAVPDHPLTKARLERIEAGGGDPFRELSLPTAVLKLRQGFGRLIRSQEDKGTVAILDPRICTKAYGRKFLESLPACTVERR